uniref:Uncharacterized protein n=1 Tax=Romanomermis culicivorax TaxID=13658 RepID=A0A915J4J3_ROMCU
MGKVPEIFLPSAWKTGSWPNGSLGTDLQMGFSRAYTRGVPQIPYPVLPDSTGCTTFLKAGQERQGWKECLIAGKSGKCGREEISPIPPAPVSL